MNNFYPIATAPKDCDVFLYFPRWGWIRGKWNDGRYDSKPRPYWTNDRDRMFGIRETRNNQPTHWMPLPAAPSPDNT